jgi:hypothetical protein
MFFPQTRSVGFCGNLNGSMLDLFNYAKFIESAWLLGPKAKDIGPCYNLIVMCS